MDYIIGFITTTLGTILGYFLSERSVRRNEFRNASDKLKDAFLDELITFERATLEIEGTIVYKVLLRAYGKHCAAIYRFNSNLTGQKLVDFNAAWHQYHYPDNNTDNGPLGYYITPDEHGNVRMIKPEFVSHKISTLLSYANP